MGMTSGIQRVVISGIGKNIILAFTCVGLAASASAADLPPTTAAASEPWYKIKPPLQPDLTWQGVSIIGAIDVAAQYERYGAPAAGALFGPGSFILPMSTSPRVMLVPNQSISSYIGLKVDRKITNDVSFIARLEVGFNPTSGELQDGLVTVQSANGVPLAQQYANGDSSRAGQIFNGEAWGGFDAGSWGAIHVGRNNAVAADMLFAYDPLLSLGFSPNGFYPYVAGEGSGENTRVDSSIKYLNKIGIFRTELMYGAPETSVNQFMQASAGIVLPSFSVDILAGKTNDSVSTGALSGAANLGSQFLGARVYDTNMYGVFAKYVFDLGSKGLEDPAEAKFTLSGGYVRLDQSNPSDGGFSPGHVTIGNYVLGPTFSTNGSPGGGIANNSFTGGDRVLDNYFIAGKYQLNEQWAVSSGLYHVEQNSYGFGVNNIPGVVAPAYSKAACSSSSFTNCSGVLNAASLRVDFDWSKNVRIYAGIAYSAVSGGLAAGFLNTYTYDPTIGIRYTF